MDVKKVSKRIHAIDLMKFFAAILITNSHMVKLFPVSFSQLATGGAIGDSLFFFCSGFTLMLSTTGGGNFFNFYKRRIDRIFPAIFAVALIKILIFGENPTIKDTVINAGGWFVQCILVYYALFFFVKRFFSNRLWIVYLANLIIILLWYMLYWDKNVFILADQTYLRWAIFFLTMLLGASTAKYYKDHSLDNGKNLFVKYTFLLLFFICFYYGFQIVGTKFGFFYDTQIILIFGLMGISYSFFRLCSTDIVLNIYKNRFLHLPVYWISALCLEIYYCQRWLFSIGSDLIDYFPLNILLTFILIVIVAYVLKILGNILSQTFKVENYNWKKIIKL